MAAPFDLTLSQAVAVAEAIDSAGTTLSAHIMDSADEASTAAMRAVHDELLGHLRTLRALIQNAQPTTFAEADARGSFLVRQAIANGETFDVVASLAADAFWRQEAFREPR